MANRQKNQRENLNKKRKGMVLVEERQDNFMLPTNDYVFKRIFGYKGNEEITKGLIREIIKKDIKEIKLTESPILEKDLKEDKMGVLDVKAVLGDGTICNIEMQVAPYREMEKRIMYYWSRLYGGGIKKGEDYKELKKTICIVIINFELESLKGIEKYHTKWEIREEEYGEMILTDVLEIDIINLKKLEKMEKENKINKNEKLTMWCRFIRNPRELGEKEMEENEEIKKAKEVLTEIEQDEHEKWLAEQRQKYIRDMHATEDYGYYKGIEELKKKVVLNMHKEGADIEFICRVVELSKEEVERIIEEKES